MTIAPLIDILDPIGVRVALIGAHAMAVRGYPRFTADVDLLTTDVRVLESAIWTTLVAAGASVDPRRGDVDDPLAGVVHIQLADETDIDVIVGRWAWQAELIERSEPIRVMGAVLAVPDTADLILLKLAAGGYIDKQDAAALLALADRQAVVRDVEARIGSVYPEVRPLWLELLASLRGA